MSPANVRPYELNLEAGRPSTEDALRRLRSGIQTCRNSGVKYIRVIHGYGSTGTGGSIRTAARSYLADLRRQGRLRGYVPGERFGSSDADAIALAANHPGLKGFEDWNRGNPGISLVVI